MTLEIKHLTHWYTDRDHKLYEDVNLTFESGRFYAIVGESGSGKTTLLSFLAGLVHTARHTMGAGNTRSQ